MNEANQAARRYTASMQLTQYAADSAEMPEVLKASFPWQITSSIGIILQAVAGQLGADYEVSGEAIVHRSATVEAGAVLKGPTIVGPDAFVAAHTYLRDGVFIGEGSTVGTGCEVKSSLIFNHSALAHFDYVGDSVIGSRVNLEAGAVVANYHNDRPDKGIACVIDGQKVPTGVEKFGALIGDDVKIGANAVTSPGTILAPGSVVGRLQLVQQA